MMANDGYLGATKTTRPFFGFGLPGRRLPPSRAPGVLHSSFGGPEASAGTGAGMWGVGG